MPPELIDTILLYLPFEKVVTISHFTANKLYNSNLHRTAYAALRGHLRVIKWLHKNNKSYCSSMTMYNAVREGHINIVKWVNENCKQCCDHISVTTAVDNYRYDIADYLSKRGYSLHVQNNYTRALKYSGKRSGKRSKKRSGKRSGKRSKKRSGRRSKKY